MLALSEVHIVSHDFHKATIKLGVSEIRFQSQANLVRSFNFFLCTHPVSSLLLCITEATWTHRSMLLMRSYLLYQLFAHLFQNSTTRAHNSTL